MGKIVKSILFVLAILVGAFVIFVVYASLSDYKPDEKIEIVLNDSADPIPDWTEYDLMIWNIGYCGLDASMDFFYDGGEQVRPDIENVKNNLSAVRNFISANDSIEFFLLQEVDKNSKRSYGINIYDSIRAALPDYKSYFGMNYKVFFVPLPPTNPMGRVNSGLQSLFKFEPQSVDRYSFPGNFDWPKGLFMLDRCFLVSRFPVRGGKELVLINTHNSAYDDGSLKAGQMEYLKGFLIEEYSKGNYIVVGGDWNQSPYGFSKNFMEQKFDNENYSEIPENYPVPGWVWAWDGSQPTNRRVKQTYSRGDTPTALIDFYLLSPNVRPVQVKTIDLNFANSDHQPVILKVLIQN